VLIEPSVNSIRVSIKIKQADEIERILCHKFTRFLMQRAESFIVLRRKPIKVPAYHPTPYLALKHHGGQGYDISFLITNAQTETMLKHKIVDFIIQCVTLYQKPWNLLDQTFQIHGRRRQRDQRDEAKPQRASPYCRRVLPYSGKPFESWFGVWCSSI
jgi:hypothetical protein